MLKNTLCCELPSDVRAELSETASKIATRGKGILAADESNNTIGKRFDQISVENNAANRSSYRELLFTTKGLGEYISGAILFEETLFSNASNGKPMVDLLHAEGIIPGIKVDKGLQIQPATPDEMATIGLDDLDARCAKYYNAGARFAKWRAVLKISDCTPSCTNISEVAHGLARYAIICQKNRLVPIVEPEILQDGDFSIECGYKVTKRVIAACVSALQCQRVWLPGILLKPNMVTPGKAHANRPGPMDVAEYTIQALSDSLPPSVPGVMFLSGGMSEEEATMNLNARNAKFPTESAYWSLSFSFGRALQQSCLKKWMGKAENVEAAQDTLLQRAKANSEAQLGKYTGWAGSEASKASLYVSNYTY